MEKCETVQIIGYFMEIIEELKEEIATMADEHEEMRQELLKLEKEATRD